MSLKQLASRARVQQYTPVKQVGSRWVFCGASEAHGIRSNGVVYYYVGGEVYCI